MSSTKIEEAVKEEALSAPVFTSSKPKKDKEEKKSNIKERGSNVTPKSDMHVGRNWSQGSWEQAFKAYERKLERLAYTKRSEAK